MFRRRDESRNRSRQSSSSHGEFDRPVSLAMGKRRKAREAAVQYHFWRDLQRGEGPEKLEEFWDFCPATSRAREFAQPLIEGMVAHLPEIDERIRRYCENYEFHRISPVDRNVLRLAIYEMLFRDDIPPVVSINE